MPEQAPAQAANARRDLLRGLRTTDEASLALAYQGLGDGDPSVRREAVRLVARSAPTPGLLLMLERALTDDRELARRRRFKPFELLKTDGRAEPDGWYETDRVLFHDSARTQA